MTKIKEFYNKHKEVLLYLFFGVLTTLVDTVVFMIFDWLFDGSLYGLSTFLAWLFSAIFAYFVNKLWVFEVKSWEKSLVVKETLEFFGARGFSLGISELGMFLFVDVCSFSQLRFELLGITITGNLIAKVIMSVIVIVLNYFFSKLIIFKKNAPKKDTLDEIAEDGNEQISKEVTDCEESK